MADKNRVTVDLTTGVGTFAFPKVFAQTASKNDKGETTFDIQFIIPKTQREDVRALLLAIKKVGEAKWGANWKKVRTPLRDGDAEKDELTEDGSTKGEKYPERLGCYFINARSTRPVGVYDRQRNVITNPEEIYAGVKGKVALTFYPYSTSGNHGIGVGLNGVQKVADGDPIGGNSRPSVESMFDLLDDEDDVDLDDVDLTEEDEVEEAPAPKPKKAAKKAPAKRAAKKAEPEPEEDDEDDLYDDLDDLDED